MCLTDIVANCLTNIKKKQNFLTIGITGNISSGKSTFAKFLKKELNQAFPQEKIIIISTDDFLYNNTFLTQHNIFDNKGWINTYDSQKINNFFSELTQQNQTSLKGKYNQLIGDVNQTTYIINNPTILIIEGTMALTPLFEDYIDISLFLDVDLEINYQWFKKRSLANLSSKKEYCHLNSDEATQLIYKIWEEVNLKTFYEYIMPNKSTANVCIDLNDYHEIESLVVRRAVVG